MKKLHKLRFAALHNLEAGQLVKSNVTDLATAGINLSTDPIIQNYVTKLTADSSQMDLVLLQVRAQQETHDLEVLDIKRDTSVRVLRMQLNIYKNSDIPAEVAAHNFLKLPFNTYKDIEKLNYEAENNAIDNFIIELAKPQYAAPIATLNLSGLITRMGNDNNSFKTLFSTRSTTTAGTATYDAKAIRKNMITNYDAYATYVLSLTNATTGMPNNGYYSSIFDIVDNIRKYYSDLIARRSGGSTPPVVTTPA
jgi:tRNA U34 5-carboxymethylaminomethyl modifying GTPase MnmE/TrmE